MCLYKRVCVCMYLYISVCVCVCAYTGTYKYNMCVHELTSVCMCMSSLVHPAIRVGMGGHGCGESCCLSSPKHAFFQLKWIN